MWGTEPTYGIHGTPEPDLVDKTASHGCVRLTNWDAKELARLVAKTHLSSSESSGAVLPAMNSASSWASPAWRGVSPTPPNVWSWRRPGGKHRSNATAIGP